MDNPAYLRVDPVDAGNQVTLLIVTVSCPDSFQLLDIAPDLRNLRFQSFRVRTRSRDVTSPAFTLDYLVYEPSEVYRLLANIRNGGLIFGQGKPEFPTQIIRNPSSPLLRVGLR